MTIEKSEIKILKETVTLNSTVLEYGLGWKALCFVTCYQANEFKYYAGFNLNSYSRSGESKSTPLKTMDDFKEKGLFEKSILVTSSGSIIDDLKEIENQQFNTLIMPDILHLFEPEWALYIIDNILKKLTPDPNIYMTLCHNHKGANKNVWIFNNLRVQEVLNKYGLIHLSEKDHINYHIGRKRKHLTS
ncbi:MAG: hypothetical protein ACK4ND_04750 [Cytophagaceae bacterium]